MLIFQGVYNLSPKLLWYSDPRRVELLLRSPDFSVLKSPRWGAAWPNEMSFLLVEIRQRTYSTAFGVRGFPVTLVQFDWNLFNGRDINNSARLRPDRLGMKHLYICSQNYSTMATTQHDTVQRPSVYHLPWNYQPSSTIIPPSFPSFHHHSPSRRVAYGCINYSSCPVDKINFRLTANQQNQNQLN